MLEINGFTPFAFQKKTIVNAIAAVQQYGGCCVFDETGLGKTITGAHIAINVGEKILIVSPKANQKSWATVLPSATICTRQKIAQGAFDVVLVDEAHNFNNPKNKSFRALVETIYFQSAKFPKVILLTATPCNNNVTEVVNMLKLIPFRLNCMPFYGVAVAGVSAMLAEKELKQIERFDVDPETGLGHSFRKIVNHVDARLAFQNSLWVLGGVMSEFCFRTTRQQIATDFSSDSELMGHFPKIHKQNVAINVLGVEVHRTIKILENLPLAYYNIQKYCGQESQTGLSGIMRTLLMKRLDSSVAAFKETLSTILATYDKILTTGVVQIDGEDYEVDGGFWLDAEKDKAGLDAIRALWEGQNDDQKIKQLIDLIDGLGDQKIVVFTEYTATQKILVEALADRKTLFYNGSSDEKLLDVIANEFDRNTLTPTNKYQILIATDALAEGVNLHTATALVHYDLKWNPSRLIQREGRVNRLVRVGLTPNDVSVYVFGVDALVETVVRLEKRLSTKTEMADSIINSDWRPDYIQNANHSSYFYKNSGFESFFGIKFAEGTIFFITNKHKALPAKICKQSQLPTVRIKAVQKEYKFWSRELFFVGDLNVGYHWRVSHIEKFFDIDPSYNEKLYTIFRNPQYGWLFFIDGKRDEVKHLFKKFEGEIPDACQLSAYEGDVVLDKVNFY